MSDFFDHNHFFGHVSATLAQGMGLKQVIPDATSPLGSLSRGFSRRGSEALRKAAQDVLLPKRNWLVSTSAGSLAGYLNSKIGNLRRKERFLSRPSRWFALSPRINVADPNAYS